MRPKTWVPSHYLGGLTLVLAMCSLALRQGPPWRVWFTVIVDRERAGKPWQVHQPDLGDAGDRRKFGGAIVAGTCWSDLGPIDPIDDTPIRRDGLLRDGDGGFYWCLDAGYCRAFASFGFPPSCSRSRRSRLAVLAGVGWDRVLSGQARGAGVWFLALLVVSLAVLAGVIWEREAILDRFARSRGGGSGVRLIPKKDSR